jgi:hypothetical protein
MKDLTNEAILTGSITVLTTLRRGILLTGRGAGAENPGPG